MDLNSPSQRRIDGMALLSKGYAIRKVAEELGVDRSVVYRWSKREAPLRAKSDTCNGRPKMTPAQIKRFRRLYVAWQKKSGVWRRRECQATAVQKILAKHFPKAAEAYLCSAAFRGWLRTHGFAWSRFRLRWMCLPATPVAD